MPLILPRKHNPSYAQGFAVRDESNAPGLWKGLVGLWAPSLGPTGLTLFDQSGFHNHGTLTNMDPAADWVVSGNPRLPGYVLDMGPIGHIECGTGVNVTDLTIVCTGKLVGGGVYWISKLDDTNDNMSWAYAASGVGQALYSSNGTSLSVVNGGGSFVTGLFHKAITYKTGIGTTFYTNGKQDSFSSAFTGSIFQGPGRVTLGARYDSGTGNYVFLFEGEIQAISVYNRALLPSEIEHVYSKPLDMFTLRPRVFPATVAAPAGFTSRNIIVGGGVI